MNTVEINIENVKPQKLAYPSCWNEMNSEQVQLAVQLLNGNLKVSEFRVKVVQVFLGKKNELFKQYWYIQRAQKKANGNKIVFDFWQQKLNQLNEYIYCISETLSFIYKKSDLTKQLIPKIKNLYGCADNFSDLTYIEFAKADTYFASYKNTNEVEYLNKFIAVLYRPARFSYYFTKWFNYTAKKRVDYSDQCLKSNISKIAKLPDSVKEVIKFHFLCYRLNIVKKHPNVFSGSDSSDDGFGYAGLLTELAGTKFGDQDKTAFTNVNDILRHLEMESIKAKELKAKIDERNGN